MNVTLKLAVALGAGAMLVTACEKKANLDSDKAKYSYAIGHQIGKNMKGQGVDLDTAAFAQAVKDISADKEPAMTQDDMRTAMRKMSEMRQEKDKKEADENKTKGAAFLDNNKKKEGVKVTDSGLQYKVLKEGEGKTPKSSDTVEVHYRGTFIDGKEFDSSYERGQPAKFPVDKVIPGWTEALQLMKVGSKYELAIPSDLAYGERGNPTIPPNSVLVFEVELLGIDGTN